MFKLFGPVWECVFYLDLSCKFSKLQYNSLAFVAGFKRATDEGSLPEIAQYSPYYLPLNVFTASRGSNLYILFLTSKRPLLLHFPTPSGPITPSQVWWYAPALALKSPRRISLSVRSVAITSSKSL